MARGHGFLSDADSGAGDVALELYLADAAVGVAVVERLQAHVVLLGGFQVLVVGGAAARGGVAAHRDRASHAHARAARDVHAAAEPGGLVVAHRAAVVEVDAAARDIHARALGGGVPGSRAAAYGAIVESNMVNGLDGKNGCRKLYCVGARHIAALGEAAAAGFAEEGTADRVVNADLSGGNHIARDVVPDEVVAGVPDLGLVEPALGSAAHVWPQQRPSGVHGGRRVTRVGELRHHSVVVRDLDVLVVLLHLKRASVDVGARGIAVARAGVALVGPGVLYVA